uniref:Uncharacterized protein n=1 Tax=Brassica campestris TaxID=3711 RepID=A0A3P6D4M1_BRACM|nr:unnamed protein product [Brassica rapa]
MQTRVSVDLLAKSILLLWVRIYSLQAHRMGLYWHGDIVLPPTALNQRHH